MKSKYYLLMLLAFIKCHSAISQGLDASPAGVMISHGHPKGGWMASYTYMNTLMENNLSGTNKVSDETIWNDYILSPHDMRMDMHMLMAMYGLTGRLSFMAMTNYTTMSMNLNIFPGTMLMHMQGSTMVMTASSGTHSHSTSGLGDVKLWALYKLVNGEGSSLILSMGLNIPTGRFDIDAGEHALYVGERHPYMMQLGTGSFDFMPGLTYMKRHKHITWSAQINSVLRPFYNSIGYHYGNEMTANVWAAYQICSVISFSLRVEGTTTGYIQGSDPKVYSVIEPDANPKNYGGESLTAYAGINYYFNKRFMRDSKLGIEFGTPFFQYLNGPQLSTTYSLNAGITKSF